MNQKLSIQENNPTDWFEKLYGNSNKYGEGVPWANMGTHPNFCDWLKDYELKGNGKPALVIGCGMGDDAIELEKLGFQVTAFDVSETAIKFCKERFPQSKVEFLQANLFDENAQWHQKFDFVLEIFTIQALPPKYEKEVIQKISNFVAPQGLLLVIANVRKESRSFENGPPWMLTPQHVGSVESLGLKVVGKKITKNALSGNEVYVTTFRKI